MVVTDLRAAHEHTVVAAGAGEAGGQNVIAAAEGAADMTADVKAGPVVNRRRRHRWGFGVRTRGHISCRCWTHEGGKSDSSEKELFHFVSLDFKAVPKATNPTHRICCSAADTQRTR